MRRGLSELRCIGLLRSLVAIAFLASASPVLAGHIYGTPAPMTGMRSIGDGLTATNDWVGLDADLAWSITDNGDGTFEYTYIMVGFKPETGPPSISHFTLDLSDDFDEATVTNPMIQQEELGAFEPIASEDIELKLTPSFDEGGLLITGGVRFDIGDMNNGGYVAYRFTSNRTPVFHHFALKGGDDSFVYNNNLFDSSLDTTNDFIAAPNSVIPEPGSLGLAWLGGLGLFSLARGRRR